MRRTSVLYLSLGVADVGFDVAATVDFELVELVDVCMDGNGFVVETGDELVAGAVEVVVDTAAADVAPFVDAGDFGDTDGDVADAAEDVAEPDSRHEAVDVQ